MADLVLCAQRHEITPSASGWRGRRCRPSAIGWERDGRACARSARAAADRGVAASGRQGATALPMSVCMIPAGTSFGPGPLAQAWLLLSNYKSLFALRDFKVAYAIIKATRNGRAVQYDADDSKLELRELRGGNSEKE